MFQISFLRFAYSAPLKLRIYFLTINLWYFHSLQTKLIWNVLVKVVQEPFFLCQSTVLIITRCFCRRTTVLKKGAHGYECCPSVGPSEGFLCLSLPVAEICAFYSSEFHKLRTTLINNLFHHNRADKISSCWSWITTSFFPTFENVP